MLTLSLRMSSGNALSGVDDLSNALADGLESVRQRVVQRLRFRAREWLLNLNAGVPYDPNIFGHRTTLALATQTITAAIRTVPDVTAVSRVESTLNHEIRTMTYFASVSTLYGSFTVTEPVTLVAV